MVVYDVSNPESFNNTQKWLQEIERYAGENVHKLLVGAKSDLPRKVPTSDAKGIPFWKSHSHSSEFADQLNLKFIETSSKTGENVFEAFSSLAITIAESLEVDVTGEVKDGMLSLPRTTHDFKAVKRWLRKRPATLMTKASAKKI